MMNWNNKCVLAKSGTIYYVGYFIFPPSNKMINAEVVVVIVSLIIIIGIMCRYASKLNPIKNTPLIFVHIPKTAGTTIRKIGFDNGYDWGYIEIPSTICLCTLLHIPPSERIKLSNKPIFTVIRNPYGRVISQYRFYCSDPTPDGLNIFIKEQLSNGWGTGQDCHWIPQYKYTQYVDHIIKYENLEDEFNNLMIQYNLPPRLNRRDNLSNGQKLSIDQISSENIALINQYYSKDFELGQYEMIKH